MLILVNADRSLSCRPFGWSSDFVLHYEDFVETSLDVYEWFHVTCTVQGGSVLLGSLVTSEVHHEYTRARIEVPDIDQFTANNQTRYKVRLGQSAARGTLALPGMQIKELRVWNASRPEGASDTYRYA